MLPKPSLPKMLVIDNYDSFTFNLVQLFSRYPLDIRVYRHDALSLADIDRLAPDYGLISPGPKDPARAGISMSFIRAFYRRIPILGVCLGMQCINEVFGGQTVRSPLPTHGKTSDILHQGQGVFQGLPSPFRAARYHSLMVELAGDDLQVTARTPDGIVMGLSHPRFPLHGVQFHPESFLTEHGPCLAENFLKLGPLPQTLVAPLGKAA